MRQAIHLYFGVREERDIYLEGHFRRLCEGHRNLRYVPVLSDPGSPTPRRTGLVPDVVAADIGDFTGFKAYLAGPPVMVEAAVDMLLRRGLPRADIHADPFYTEAEKAARQPRP